MNINFYLNWEEYFAAQEFFHYSQSGLTPEYFRGGVLIVFGAVLFSMGDLTHLAAGVMILGLVVIFCAPLVRRWISRHKWDREPLYRTEYKISANEEGVHFQMGKIESSLVWQYYQRFLESPDGFLLIYGGDAFNYLPKRAFASEVMIDQFRSLVTAQLSNRGRI